MLGLKSPSKDISVSLGRSLYLSLCLSVCMSVFLSLSLSLSLSIYLPLSLNMANRPVAHYLMVGSNRNDCEVLLVPLCRGARWSGPGLGPLQIYSGQGMGPGRLKQTKTEEREKGAEGGSRGRFIHILAESC